MPLFWGILSWKQGNHALECSIFNLYWCSLPIWKALMMDNMVLDMLINFSADYDLETAVWKKWPGYYKVPLFWDISWQYAKLKRKMTIIALMANRLKFHFTLKNRKSAQKYAPGGIFCIIILTRLVHICKKYFKCTDTWFVHDSFRTK